MFANKVRDVDSAKKKKENTFIEKFKTKSKWLTMRQVKAAEQRVAMSYEFEDLLKQLQSKKDKSQQQTESQRMQKLNQILSQSMKTFQLNINGNQTTKYDFIKDEFNVTTPDTIDNCSIQIFDGINVCQKFLLIYIIFLYIILVIDIFEYFK